MAIPVPKNSRLRFADLIVVDGVEHWDLLQLADIPTQRDDLKYLVKTADRIDLLARRFYGDAVLWWVIALANGMEIVPTALNDGQVLRIPSPRFVQQVLFAGAD